MDTLLTWFRAYTQIDQLKATFNDLDWLGIFAFVEDWVNKKSQ